MAHGGIPVVQLRRLRGELRRARESAGITQKQVAKDLGWSLSKVIRIETGAADISTSVVMALLHYYQITDTELADELLAITRTKEETRWWDEYRETSSPRFIDFLTYEDSAARIRQFQWLTVPGLLQTEAYARALFSVRLDAGPTERALRVRMTRQKLLERPDGAEMLFILDEAVVHRLVGGPEVMREQLAHLKELNARPRISIQIVPFSAGASVGMSGSFTIFDLTMATDDNLDYVVNVEEPNGDVLIRERLETTSSYVETFYEIRETALTKEESNTLLDAVVNST
jgi:transcriptional regulator with XRE-family HTH domain